MTALVELGILIAAFVWIFRLMLGLPRRQRRSYGTRGTMRWPTLARDRDVEANHGLLLVINACASLALILTGGTPSAARSMAVALGILVAVALVVAREMTKAAIGALGVVALIAERVFGLGCDEGSGDLLVLWLAVAAGIIVLVVVLSAINLPLRGLWTFRHFNFMRAVRRERSHLSLLIVFGVLQLADLLVGHEVLDSLRTSGTPISSPAALIGGLLVIVAAGLAVEPQFTASVLGVFLTGAQFATSTLAPTPCRQPGTLLAVFVILLLTCGLASRLTAWFRR